MGTLLKIASFIQGAGNYLIMFLIYVVCSKNRLPSATDQKIITIIIIIVVVAVVVLLISLLLSLLMRPTELCEISEQHLKK